MNNRKNVPRRRDIGKNPPKQIGNYKSNGSTSEIDSTIDNIKRILILFLILLIPVSFVSGYLIEGIKSLFRDSYSLIQADESGFFKYMYTGLFSGTGFILTILLTSLFGWIIFMAIKVKNSGERYRIDSSKNVKISNTNEYGSSTFHEEEKLNQIYNTSYNPNEFSGQILGKSLESGKIVSLNYDKMYGNKNVFVIGSAGTGKSRAFAKPAIQKIVERGENLIATDPKGELASDCFNFLQENGYDVKILNVKDISKSDGWNLMNEILLGDDVDKATMIQNVADSVVSNSTDRKDNFAKSSQNLLSAILCIVVFAEKVKPKSNRGIPFLTEDGKLNFRAFKTEVTAKEKDDVFTLQILEGESIYERNISTVYDMASLFSVDLLDCIFTDLNDDHPGKRSYMRFKDSSASFKGNVAQNLATMLQLFSNSEISKVFSGSVECIINSEQREELKRLQDLEKEYNKLMTDPLVSDEIKQIREKIKNKKEVIEKLEKDYEILVNRNILEVTNIDILSLAKRKTALFVIMSDQSETFSFVLSIFFSVLFTVLVKYIDSKMEKSVSTTPTINCILDEFPSIGKIPEFEKKMATLRQRKINITIIIQNIGQLYNLYPNYVYDSIISNCAVKIFLGTDDLNTATYISKLSGTYTGIIESESSSKNSLSLVDYQPEYKLSQGKGKVELISIQDALGKAYDEVFIFYSGVQGVTKLKKYFFEENPRYKEFTYFNISKYIPFRKKGREELIVKYMDKKKDEERREYRERVEETFEKSVDNISDSKVRFLKKTLDADNKYDIFFQDEMQEKENMIQSEYKSIFNMYDQLSEAAKNDIKVEKEVKKSQDFEGINIGF